MELQLSKYEDSIGGYEIGHEGRELVEKYNEKRHGDSGKETITYD